MIQSSEPEQAENAANQQCSENMHNMHGKPFLYINLNNVREIRFDPDKKRFKVYWVGKDYSEDYFVNPMSMPRVFGRENWVCLI